MQFNAAEINRYKGYSYIPKSYLSDNTLSLKAKGLLTIAFSLPEDWVHTKQYYCDHNKDGRESIDSTIQELISKHYLRVGDRVRLSNGQLSDTKYSFYAIPYTDNNNKVTGTLIKSQNEPTTLMTNYHLRDTNLSLKAKGLLSIMFSFPDTVNYCEQKFVGLNLDGLSSVRSTIKELKKNMYLEVQKGRGVSGNFAASVYKFHKMPNNTTGSICENPQLEKPQMDNPSMESHQLENPQLENPETIKTQKTKTYIYKDLSNKQNKKKENVCLLSDNDYENLKCKYPQVIDEAYRIAKMNLANGTKCNNFERYVEGIAQNLQKPMKLAVNSYPTTQASYDLKLFNDFNNSTSIKYQRKR